MQDKIMTFAAKKEPRNEKALIKNARGNHPMAMDP